MKSLLHVALLLSFLLPAFPARGGEGHITAGMGFSGEYNDNIQETASNPEADFITHIKPSLRAEYEGGRIQAELGYRGDYKFHVQGKDSDEYRHYLRSLLQAEVVENLFFLNLQEDLEPVYRNASLGPYVEGDTTRDMVNRNKFSVTPFFMLHPSERTSLRSGYSFTDLRYGKQSEQGISPAPWDNDYSLTENTSTQHRVFSDLTHEVSDRLTFFSGVSALQWDSEKDENGHDASFARYQAYLGGQYEIAEGTVLQARGGPTRTEPEEGGSTLWPYVDASLNVTVGRSLFGLAYSMDFVDDPDTGGSMRHTALSASWKKEFDRSRLSASVGYHVYKGETQSDERNDHIYRPSLAYTYELSERLAAFVRGSADILQSGSDYGDRYYGSIGLNYQLSENKTVSLSYNVKRIQPSEVSRGYTVNRIFLDLFVTF